MSKLKKLFAFTLAMIMIVGTLGVGTAAQGDVDSTDGLVMSKKYDQNSSTLTLEAYVTGETVTISKSDPIDVVLVLDVSGSMDDGLDQYEAVYDIDTNGTYYIKDGDSYKRVYKCRLLSWLHSGWYDGYHGVFIHRGDKVSPKTSENSEGVQFYKNTSKIDALKNTVTDFIENVASKPSESKIAIVKFAGDNRNTVGNDTYESGSNEYNYSQIVSELTTADADGAKSLKDAVDSLVAGGATHADYGMAHAKSILDDVKDNGRKKVVIMFTDGEPNGHDGFDSTVANAAISTSASLKEDGVTVYTIGCFDNPDASSKGSEADWNKLSNVNKYMNLVSSNFNSNAKSMTASFSNYSYGSFYKTASSSEELTNIFKALSEVVGGASYELSEESVVKDVISEYFDFPTTTDGKIDTSGITAHTETCTAIDSDGKPTTWTSDNNASDFKDKINVDEGNKTISVTGFDFSSNWVGSHSGVAGGKKLVITIPIVDNGTGFGTVPTNVEEKSGVYENANSTEPIKKFEKPEATFPYYTVKHVQDGKIVETKSYRIDGKASLTALVSEGYLYGGAFADAEGYDTPITFNNGESGVSFTPENLATYCIWEVPNTYLQPKCLTIWAGGQIAGNSDVKAAYLVAAVDRLAYYDVGFDVTVSNGSKDEIIPLGNKAQTLYSSLYVENKDGTANTYTSKSLGVADGGYMACYKAPKTLWANANDSITYTPYWITLDGVKVTGTGTRTATYLGEGEWDSHKRFTTSGETTSSTSKYVGLSNYAPQTLSLISLCSLDADSYDEVPTPVAPTAPEGYLEVKYFEQGWFKVYGVTLLSAIENDDYAETGFKINGVNYSCSNVIGSYGICSARILFGENVSRDSKLMTYNLSLRGYSDGDPISVTPYWTTKDGNTVYGTERVLTYNSRDIIG